MDSLLIAMGLEPGTGLAIVGVALACGLVLGIGMATAVPELPFSFQRHSSRLRVGLAILAAIGLLAILAVPVGMVIDGIAIAPIIIFVSVGLLGGPLIAQSLERLQASRVISLVALIVAEGVIVSMADTYIL